MQIALYCMGSLKEKHWIAAVKEYEKRLLPGFEIREFKEERLPENPSEREIAKALDKEAERVLSKLPQSAGLVLLTKEGKQYTSESLSRQLTHWQANGPVVFFIGSSYGIGAALRAGASAELSFSRLTFPHQLMRVIFLEQLYRAQSIAAGSKYHK